MRKFKDILNIYGDQLLTESSVARIFTKYFETGFIIISADRTAEAELGRSVTFEENEEQHHQNNLNQQKIKDIIRKAGYGFVPMLGGFRERVIDVEGNETLKDVIGEASFLIPSIRPGSTEKIIDNDDNLIHLGCDLSTQFNQDSFLYKPSNEFDVNAYYITRDGTIEKIFEDCTIDNMSQIYFSLLRSHSKNRLSFVENFIRIPKSPKSATEARERYGELFWKFI